MNKTNHFYQLLVRVSIVIMFCCACDNNEVVRDNGDLLTDQYGGIDPHRAYGYLRTYPVNCDMRGAVKVQNHFSNNNVETKIIHTNSIQFVLTKVAKKDLQVKVTVDNTLIAAFNKKDRKAYQQLPEDAYKIDESFDVKKGSKSSNVPFKFTHPEKLTNPKGYVLPIVLQSVSSDVEIETNRKVLYYVIDSEIYLHKNNLQVADVPQKSALDTSSWSIEGVVNENLKLDDALKLLDGNYDTYCAITSSSQEELYINLSIDTKKPITLNEVALIAMPMMYQYLCPQSISIVSVREDGAKIVQEQLPLWLKDAKNNNFYITFKEPVTTNKIDITLTTTMLPYRNFYCFLIGEIQFF